MLTWLRSTRARLFIPFDDNINFHKVYKRMIVLTICIRPIRVPIYVAHPNMHCRIVPYKLTMHIRECSYHYTYTYISTLYIIDLNKISSSSFIQEQNNYWELVKYKQNNGSSTLEQYVLASTIITKYNKFNTTFLSEFCLQKAVCKTCFNWEGLHFLSLYLITYNANFQIIACAIGIGVIVHAGNHMACDFPRLVNSSPEKFALIASDFNNRKPSYKSLLTGVEGITGISMVILLIIAFTLATRHLRKNVVKLPAPFNRLTGFNAFWFSHHLTCLVYILLLIHGNFLYFAHKWYQKTVRTLI